MMRLISESPLTAMSNALNLVGLCALLVVLSIIPMVGFDVIFQLYTHFKKLRMSRQDIRDEYKQMEGDPHVKGRIRQMQRAAARRRMMDDVPKADVIVTNPTHYSVALRYDENKMSAPKVVAKGAGLIALRIREIGTENRVPILEARRWRVPVPPCGNWTTDPGTTLRRRGGSAGLGMAVETLASGWRSTACET
jgi:flagellar biosynthetic protein FlhB